MFLNCAQLIVFIPYNNFFNFLIVGITCYLAIHYLSQAAINACTWQPH